MKFIEFLKSSRDAAAVKLMTTDELAGIRGALSHEDGESGAFARTVDPLVLAFETALDTSSVVRSLATILRTSQAGELRVPYADERDIEGVQIAAGADAGELDVGISARVLRSYKYSSKRLRYSFELENNASAFATSMGTILGQRIGRIQGRKFAVGSGASEPMGIVTAATPVAAAGATVALADLIDLQAGLPAPYRPGATWLMAGATWKAILKLDWTTAPHLFEALFGREGAAVAICDDVPTPGAGKRSVVYADFSRYLVRDVGSLRLFKYLENYVQDDQRALEAWLESDATLTDPLAAVALAHPAG